MNGLLIIPECYVDTCLIETITNCYNQFNHQKGCSQVAKVMQVKLNHGFALGIIDKDKHEIVYIKEFDLLASKGSLFLYKHKTNPHYILQIYPAIEKFFLKAANEKGINIADYGLPTDFKILKKVTKSMADKNEENFKKLKRLFKDLADASELSILANLILYMGDKTYNVNVSTLKKFLE